MRIFKVGDLVRGDFVDHTDRYDNGSPKHKPMVGIVAQVAIEEGYETYRVGVLIHDQIRWAFDSSLTLVEAT